MKALKISSRISPLTLILLVILLSYPYTIVAPSGGAMGGEGEGDEGGEGGEGGSDGSGGSDDSDGSEGSDGSGATTWSSNPGSNQASGGGDGDGDNVDDEDDDKLDRKSIIGLAIMLGVSAVVAFAVLCHCCCTHLPSLESEQTTAVEQQQTTKVEQQQTTKVPQISVIKLQVALKGTAVSFQRDLNAIARTADTSKKSGMKYVLEESAKALLRHSNYWLSSYLSVTLRSYMQHANYVFKDYSREERSKFDRETLTNIDDYKRERIGTGAVTFTNPFILVTFILESTELLQLHQVNTTKDLEAVLQKFTTVSQNGIVACHVLWTPQEENDCLTEKQLLQDYPNLRQLEKEVKLTIH